MRRKKGLVVSGIGLAGSFILWLLILISMFKG